MDVIRSPKKNPLTPVADDTDDIKSVIAMATADVQIIATLLDRSPMLIHFSASVHLIQGGSKDVQDPERHQRKGDQF